MGRCSSPQHGSPSIRLLYTQSPLHPLSDAPDHYHEVLLSSYHMSTQKNPLTILVTWKHKRDASNSSIIYVNLYFICMWSKQLGLGALRNLQASNCNKLMAILHNSLNTPYWINSKQTAVHYFNKQLTNCFQSICEFSRHLFWLIHIRCYWHKINN